MPDVRLIDANKLIKDIAESIKLADEWKTESHKKQDKHGLKCAIDTRRALLAMISRVKDAPTIDAQPVKHGKWIKIDSESFHCSECDAGLSGICVSEKYISREKFCYNCGAKMDGDAE